MKEDGRRVRVWERRCHKAWSGKGGFPVTPRRSAACLTLTLLHESQVRFLTSRTMGQKYRVAFKLLSFVAIYYSSSRKLPW